MILRLGSKFLENGVVNTELARGVVISRVGICHEQRHGNTFRSLGESGQELSPMFDNRFRLASAGIKLYQLRVKLRATFGVRKLFIQQGNQFGGSGAVKI